MRLGLALSTVALLVTSCGGGGTHRVTEADNLAELDVEVGDIIEVSLEENPSTGYGWRLAPLPDMLEPIGDEYVAAESDDVGAPGTRELRFEVVSADAGILRLEYVRPFDDPPVPERIVEYVIVAGDAALSSTSTG